MTVTPFPRFTAGKRHALPDALRETFGAGAFGQHRLADLWARHETVAPDSPGAADTAYPLAVAVGYSLLFGTKPKLLPAPTAAAALRQLRDRLPAWTREVATLQFDDDLAFQWIRARTDAYALMEAARGAEAELHDRGDAEAAKVSVAFDEVWQPLDEFDAALEVRKPDLAPLIGRDRLRAFRELLAADYRAPLPWWLDPDSFR